MTTKKKKLDASQQKEQYYLCGVFVLIVIIATAIAFYSSFKDLQSQSEHPVNIPWSLQDLKNLNQEMNHLKEEKFLSVFTFFASFYILKQTFCLPGSFWLNIWAGNLFGLVNGFALACFLTAFGASCCYWVSHFLLRNLIIRCFSHKILTLQKKIESQEDDLFWFLILLRIVPFTPNWLLNLLSPILDVPFRLFWLSIFIGLMPYNFIAVQTGTILTDLGEGEDIFDVWTIMKLLSIALVYLVFIIVKSRMSKKVNHQPIKEIE